MSVELWEQGVIIEFNKGIPCHRAMVRSVGKAEVVLVDIENGAVSRLSREELGTVYAQEVSNFLRNREILGILSLLIFQKLNSVKPIENINISKGLKKMVLVKSLRKVPEIR